MKENIYDKKWNGKGYDENLNITYELINGDGKVKEYDYEGRLEFEGEYINGKLIYKGEYRKGRKTGNGDDYSNENISILKINNNDNFQGEFLFNRKWTGKEYDKNGNLVCEIINGKGKGKEYYSSGKLKFEGEYFDGRKWNGKEYDENGELKCEFKNGHGFGKEYGYNSKIIFEGEYLNEKRNGKGKEYDNNDKKNI